MENPKTKHKSALHWENQKARECLNSKQVHAQLLAELIREYLEFYKLDYSKQIFVPETNLTTVPEASRDTLAAKTGLTNQDDGRKPLLLHILEAHMKGEKSAVTSSAPNLADTRQNSKAPAVSPAPGINSALDSSDNKGRGSPGVGDGIL